MCCVPQIPLSYGAAFGAAEVSREVLEGILRRCDIRGSTVRIDSSAISNSDRSLIRLTREGEQPHLIFRIIKQWRWRYPDIPIVLLEALAFLTMYKYLAKRACFHGKRHFELFDALGSMGAFAKGRSFSIRMNRICRKVAALSIFSDITFYYAYCNSESQPMGVGSRIFDDPSVKLKEFERNFT